MFLLAFPRSASAGKPEDAYDSAKASYKALQAMPESKKKFQHNWQAVIDKFKAVAETWPKSSVADDALFSEGKLYFDLYEYSRVKDDLSSAVEAWKACATKYPSSNLADDSLLWEAKAQHMLGRHEKEAAALRELVEKYPKADTLKEAKRTLAKIESEHEVSSSSVATASPSATPTATLLAVASPTPTPAPVSTAVATPTIAASPAMTSGGEAGAPASIEKVKVISNADYTRVVVYTGGPVHWEAHQIKAEGDKGPRVYVDFTNAKVGEALKKELTKAETNEWTVPIGDGLLTLARVGQRDSKTVRVVLDVTSIKGWQLYPFDDPFRLVLDFSGDAVAPKVASADPTPTPKSGEPTPELSPEAKAKYDALKVKEKGGISLAQQFGLKVGTIYVDAGHGGHDTGAIGPTKVREKDVTLAIAGRLQKKLMELGYDARLTRKDDTYLELEERTGIANGGHGDLFISVHCNSTERNPDPTTGGVETYYADIASDSGSERLSAIENKTSPKHMSELDAMLQTLLRGAFTEQSAAFAKVVQDGVVAGARKLYPKDTRDHGVKSALFYVCLTAKMPAILVETSFLSNPKEEKRLVDPKYQQQIADSIAASADDYLNALAAKAPAAVPSGTPEQKASITPAEEVARTGAADSGERGRKTTKKR